MKFRAFGVWRHVFRAFGALGAFRAIAGLALLAAASSALAFDLQGHRGTRGMAPENTMVAFETAMAVGVNTLELDVGITSDGVVVIGHDPALNPDLARNAQGQWLRQLGMERGPTISSLTWAQLQTYDVGRINPASRYATTFATQVPKDGERMPRLAALFERVKALKADHIRFNIEIKITPSRPDETLPPREFVQSLMRVIDAQGMRSRVTIQSFDWRTLAVMAELAPEVPRVYLSAQRPTFDTISDGSWTVGRKLSEHKNMVALVAYFAKGQRGAVWSPNFADLTQELVKEAKAAGIQVIPWTVNDAQTAQKLIDWQVDGIISDYPLMIREVMASKGMRLPMSVPNALGSAQSTSEALPKH